MVVLWVLVGLAVMCVGCTFGGPRSLGGRAVGCLREWPLPGCRFLLPAGGVGSRGPSLRTLGFACGLFGWWLVVAGRGVCGWPGGVGVCGWCFDL